MAFINSNYAYADSYLINDVLGEKETIILGSNQEITEVTQKINEYLTYNNELKLENKNQVNNLDYISKPLVLETKSRKAIEDEKIKKEQEAQAIAYANNYSNYYNNYSRNTITRDIENREFPINNANSYYYGYCTWYVANKINVPNYWGNAGQWLYSAQNSGYETSREAKNNSIIVTGESGWGHVGVVESVNDNTITISEMNYNGWGTVSTREIPKDSPVIKGFIY